MILGMSGEFFHKHWKPLMFITIIVLILTGGVLLYNTVTTGSPLERDIELQGGKQISIALTSEPDLDMLSKEIPEASFKLVTGAQDTLLVEIPDHMNETEVIEKLKSLGVTGDYNIRIVGPALGEVFWKQAQIALVVAFILMGLVVFVLFRTFVPSMAIILAAITDIVFAMFGMYILGIPLSLPTLAALLIVIGYSVDTDVVLTAEVLKTREGDIKQKINSAFKTGITMTTCAIAALVALYFVSGNIILQQMSLVIIVGLAMDLPVTWITNTGILRWYVERRERKLHHNK